jgi:hypothetical protein
VAGLRAALIDAVSIATAVGLNARVNVKIMSDQD